MYGFGQIAKAKQRGATLTMAATPNDGAETEPDSNEPEAKEVEVVKASDADKAAEEAKAKFNPVYAFFVLFVVLACRIMVQWHRKGLTYAYGYTALGELAGSSVYEISSYYPQLKQWYGLLAGFIYTIPYASFGLLAGKISDQVNRKLFLGIVVILASLTMGVSAFTSSFAVFGAMRILHGMMNSASNPLSFSLIADYFPPDRRATANSIIQAGNYIGVGVSSLSILLISSYGWKIAYGIMAAAGIAFGAATMLFVKEPERGRFLSAEEKAKEAKKKKEKEEAAAKQSGNPIQAFFENIGVVFKLPCARNVLMASSLRNFGGMIVSSFLPVFFGKNFPAFKAEYALLNAAALSICGLVASLAGGILADKLEKKTKWAKAGICMTGCALSLPLIALGTLTTGNFYLSVLCYALKVLVSGTYSGPAITMIQNTAPQDQQGNVVSVYFFCITLAQTISPAIFGYIANAAGALTNPALYGPLITAFVAFGYIGSLPFWWRAGKAYKEVMEEKEAQAAIGGAAPA